MADIGLDDISFTPGCRIAVKRKQTEDTSINIICIPFILLLLSVIRFLLLLFLYINMQYIEDSQDRTVALPELQILVRSTDLLLNLHEISKFCLFLASDWNELSFTMPGHQCGRRSCQHTPGFGIYFPKTISLKEYQLVLPEQDQDSTSYCHLVAKLQRHKIDLILGSLPFHQNGWQSVQPTKIKNIEKCRGHYQRSTICGRCSNCCPHSGKSSNTTGQYIMILFKLWMYYKYSQDKGHGTGN